MELLTSELSSSSTSKSFNGSVCVNLGPGLQRITPIFYSYFCKPGTKYVIRTDLVLRVFKCIAFVDKFVRSIDQLLFSFNFHGSRHFIVQHCCLFSFFELVIDCFCFGECQNWRYLFEKNRNCNISLINRMCLRRQIQSTLGTLFF